MPGQIPTLPSLRRALTGVAALMASAAPLALPAAAQTVAQQAAPFHLGALTLLGTGLETTVFRNPSAVSVVDDEEIERTPPTRVADYLRSVPGVRVEEQGITRIAIRGEDARRVRILIDGQAVTDHTTYGPPVVVDPAMVERIEVVRGASSVVSGQRAIGGTINIITRRGAEAPLEGFLTASYFGATRGYRLSGSLAGRQGGFTWRITAGEGDFGNHHAAGVGELDRTDTQDRNLSLWLGYEWGNHQIGLQATAFDLAANVFVPTASNPYQVDPNFIIQMPGRDLRKLGLFYTGTDLAPWLTRLEVNAFHQTIHRLFANDVTTYVQIGPMLRPVRIQVENDDMQTTSGLNVTGELRFSDQWRGVFGFQHEDDFLDVNSRSQATPPIGAVPPPRYRYTEARIRTTSAFMQQEYEFSPTLTGTAGLRWYRVDAALESSREVSGSTTTIHPTRSTSDSRLLGSLGLTWQPSDQWVFRASASQGYNYPTLNQLFTTTVAGGETTLPNPDLRPEASDNFEIGARFDNGATVVDATLFHARASDYILRVPLPGGGTNPEGRYENVSSATTTGLEVYAEHALEGGWTPFITAAWTRRELDYGNGFTTYDSGTPSFSGTLGVRRDFTIGIMPASLEAYVTAESGVRLRGESGALTGSTRGYGVVGLRGSLDISRNARVTLAVNNLFDRQYIGWGQLPAAERSLDLVLQARF